MPYTRVRLNAFGGPDEMELESVADLPEAAAGEVRVRVLVTSAAFTDVMIRKGMNPDVKDKPPFTPGYDMVRIVDATGPGSTRFTPGERVAELTTIGAYSDDICLAEDRLTPVPAGVSDVSRANGRFPNADGSEHPWSAPLASVSGRTMNSVSAGIVPVSASRARGQAAMRLPIKGRVGSCLSRPPPPCDVAL